MVRRDGERDGQYHSSFSSYYGLVSWPLFTYGEGKAPLIAIRGNSTDIYPREQKKEALESPQESSDEETDTVIVDGTPALKN